MPTAHETRHENQKLIDFISSIELNTQTSDTHAWTDKHVNVCKPQIVWCVSEY